MIRNRRVEVLLPEQLVQELDNLARSEQMNRSGIIREAALRYISDRRKSELRRQLRDGYAEMGNLNLELADDLGFESFIDGANTLERE